MGNKAMDIEANASQDSYKVLSLSSEEALKRYRGLIFSKYLRSLKSGSYYFRMCDSVSFFQNYHLYFENLLKRPQIKFHIAVLSDNEDVVLGWAVKEGHTLHYVYVSPEQSGQGIARTLCGVFSEVTQMTEAGAKIWKKMKHIKVDYWG